MESKATFKPYLQLAVWVNIVSKYTFYELPNATKTPIKQFLQKIRKKYNLKKSVSEKQLIDELEVHNIYTNEVVK